MAKTKQSAVVYAPHEMAEFASQPESEGLTLITLEARVSNLERSVNLILQQLVDISQRIDALHTSQQKQRGKQQKQNGNPQQKQSGKQQKQKPNGKQNQKSTEQEQSAIAKKVEAQRERQKAESERYEAESLVVFLDYLSDDGKEVTRDSMRENTGLSGKMCDRLFKKLVNEDVLEKVEREGLEVATYTRT